MMRAPRHLAALLAAALACGSPSAPDGGTVPNYAVAVAPLDYDGALSALKYYSGYGDRDRLVIRDRSTWSRVWLRAATTASSHSLPQVDFERHMIIFAAMGSQPSTGYRIEIEELYRGGEDMYVVVRETSPGPTCGVRFAITAPLTAALVPRTRGRVHFVERTTITVCDEPG